MLALVAGIAADIIVGYAKDKVISKIGDIAIDKANGLRVSEYLKNETMEAAADVKVIKATEEILTKKGPGYDDIHSNFANTVMTLEDCEDPSWFVETAPVVPCGKRLLEKIKEDMCRLVTAVKNRIWNNKWFRTHLGEKNIQKILVDAVIGLNKNFKELREENEYLRKKYKELEEEVSKLSKTPKLIETWPSSSAKFFGREEEFKKIDEAFEKDHIVFITGFAGMGKSELCREYVKRLKQEDEGIKSVWLTYSKSIKNTIVEKLRFSDFDETKYDSMEKLFNAKMDALSAPENSNTIIVLDNYVWESKLDDLNRMPWKVLVTTRKMNVDRTTVCVGKLTPEESFSLLRSSVIRYSSDVGMLQWVDSNSKGLEEALRKIDYHTLMIPLMAGLICEELPDPKDIGTDIFGFDDIEVEIEKDETVVTANIERHFETLMNGFNLDEAESDAIHCMSILPAEGMEKKLFMSLTRTKNSTISRLVSKGMATCKNMLDHLVVQVHPLVSSYISSKYPFKCVETDPRRRFIISFDEYLDSKKEAPYPSELLDHVSFMRSIDDVLSSCNKNNLTSVTHRSFSRAFSQMCMYNESLEHADKFLKECKEFKTEDYIELYEAYSIIGGL